MDQSHPFTIEVMADPLDATRFRWAICEGVQIILRSPKSYELRDEAERDAQEALKRTDKRHSDK
jgi:hypothetical protein